MRLHFFIKLKYHSSFEILSVGIKCSLRDESWKRNFCIKLKWLSSWAPH